MDPPAALCPVRVGLRGPGSVLLPPGAKQSAAVLHRSGSPPIEHRVVGSLSFMIGRDGGYSRRFRLRRPEPHLAIAGGVALMAIALGVASQPLRISSPAASPLFGITGFLMVVSVWLQAQPFTLRAIAAVKLVLAALSIGFATYLFIAFNHQTLNAIVAGALLLATFTVTYRGLKRPRQAAVPDPDRPQR